MHGIYKLQGRESSAEALDEGEQVVNEMLFVRDRSITSNYLHQGGESGSHIRQSCAALSRSCTLTTRALALREGHPASPWGEGAVTSYNDTKSSKLTKPLPPPLLYTAAAIRPATRPLLYPSAASLFTLLAVYRHNNSPSWNNCLFHAF